MTLRFERVYPKTNSSLRLVGPRQLVGPTPSLPWCHFKTTNKSVTLETLNCFCLLFCTGLWKDFHRNTYSTESICYGSGKHTVCRHVRASLSPELLQALGSVGVNWLSMRVYHKRAIRCGYEWIHFRACVTNSMSATSLYWRRTFAETLQLMMMMKWCLMSSGVSWHIRDKLWPMPKHGSIILYVHGNQKVR